MVIILKAYKIKVQGISEIKKIIIIKNNKKKTFLLNKKVALQNS